jgi:DNA-binding LacI/PurR family transcriptional regulator
MSVQRLLAKIEGEAVGHEVVPIGPELIMRESTAVVRGGTLRR